MVAVAIANNHGLLGIDPPSKPPRLDAYIYLLAAMSAIGGFLFGYDTGIVSSAFLFVPHSPDLRPMSNLWKEVLIAITPGMAGVGSLLSGYCSDRFGRRYMILWSTVICAVGSLMCAIGVHKVIMLVGRAVLGIAVGIASMIVPIYISEAAPANIRGKLVTGFQAMISFGYMASNVIAGCFSYVNAEVVGWRLMFACAAVPAVVQFIGFLFLPESPRWLFENRDGGKISGGKAAAVLRKIYSGEESWVEYELAEIEFAHQHHQREMAALGGSTSVIWRILTTPPVRRALMVGCALQGFQQLSGFNTVMYYTSDIIRFAGVRNSHTIIWISVGTSSVLFVATIFPYFLIERLGRRKLLAISVVGIIVSLLLLSGSFYLINRDTAPTVDWPSDALNVNGSGGSHVADECRQLSNCDFCVTDERCGFCSFMHGGDDDRAAGGNEPSEYGYCLPAWSYAPNQRSTVGPCSGAMPLTSLDESEDAEEHLDEHYEDDYDNGTRMDGGGGRSRRSTRPLSEPGYEWRHVSCKTSYSYLPIICIVIYTCSFSLGYAPLPWVLNAEFYPLWARSTCVSLSTFHNWLFNLVVTLTFLSLVEWVSRYGAFLVYTVITIIALIVFMWSVPETKGCSLDEVQFLFMTKKEREAAEVEAKLTTANKSTMTSFRSNANSRQTTIRSSGSTLSGSMTTTNSTC